MDAKEQFTKEQLDAISIIHKLYSLDKDIGLAWKIFIEKTKNNKIKLCHLKRSEIEFYSAVPHLFISLVEAIERGDLIFKQDLTSKEELLTREGITITNK